MMRHTAGYFAVWFYVGGARNGRQFKTEAEARATLDGWEQRCREEQAAPCHFCGYAMSDHGPGYKCPEGVTAG